MKRVQIASNDVSVINRYHVAPVVSNLCKQSTTDALRQSDIDALFDKLYPFTQTDEAAKVRHIENIRNKETGVAENPNHTAP